MMDIKTFASGRTKADSRMPLARRAQRGFSLIELMIGMAVGLLMMVAMSELFVNITRTNSEMAKTNSQIESGRFAIQLLAGDIAHGGFWGGYIPPFDDLTMPSADYDAATMAPGAVPGPCLAYASWDVSPNLNYRNNLIAIPVQSYDSVPAGCSAVVVNKKANTDVLVMRHAETRVAGVGDCEPAAGKVCFQASQCEDEISAVVQAAGDDTITLSPSASPDDDFYNGATIRIISGPGVTQTRLVIDYDGDSKMATLAAGWTSPKPNNTSYYSFGNGYVLETSVFPFHKKGSDCSIASAADKRKFISNIYYVSDVNGIPTLMKSSFDGTAHQAAVPLIEGIEGFRVELGIDSTGDAATLVDYTKPLVWFDEQVRNTPLNRGDGIPDVYCTTASPCTAAQLPNVVAVKLYVLARNRDITVGYTDNKTYALGETTLGPFGDHYKRHVFSTTVRLTNVSARRETP